MFNLSLDKDIEIIFHISDVHIRFGESKLECRYNEYLSIFHKLVEYISNHNNLKKSIILITGDIFHNKTKLDSICITLFFKLIDMLSSLTELFLILGNHDFRADKIDRPDLLESLLESKYKKNDRVFYLKDTGHYVVNNIGFGLMSVKDIILSGNSSGQLVSDIPTFPDPILFEKRLTKIALYHGIVESVNVPSMVETVLPINYFKGYDIGMFGDLHTQSVESKVKDKFIFGYSGSLIQQNFGEDPFNHGFLEWDIKKKQALSIPIQNDTALIKLSFDSGKWIITNSKKIRHIFDEIDTKNFNFKKVTIRIVGKYTSEAVNELKTKLENNNIQFDLIFFGNITTDQRKYDIKNIIELNTEQHWVEYIESKLDENLEIHKDWKQFIFNLEQLQIPLDDNIIPSLHTKINKKNNELINEIEMKNKTKITTTKQFKLKYLECDWILCFKDKCWFNFENLNSFTTLIEGKNGYGKSSFIELILIALFGETSPSKTNSSYSASVIHKKKPEKAKASVRLHFELDGHEYQISRNFRRNTNDFNVLKDSEVVLKSSVLDVNLSGNKTVSDWVKYNICTMEKFMLLQIITQSETKDFFSLKESDQIQIIESSQNIETINNTNNVIESALKNLQSIKTSIEDVLNHQVGTVESFNDIEYEDLKQKLLQLNEKQNQLKSKIVDEKEYFDIHREDFDEDFEKNILEVSTLINEIDCKIPYDELLLLKGKHSYLLKQKESLKQLKYNDDIFQSKEYVKQFSDILLEKNSIMEKTKELNDEIVTNRKQIHDIDCNLKKNGSSQNHEIINKTLKTYIILEKQKSTIVSNIAKLTEKKVKYQRLLVELHEIEQLKKELNTKIKSIIDYKHPFNKECIACKNQLWRKELTNLEDSLSEIEIKEKTLKLHEDKNKQKLDTINASLTENEDNLRIIETTNTELLEKELNLLEKRQILNDRISSIELEVGNNLKIIHEQNKISELLIEHQQLIDNQEDWFQMDKTILNNGSIDDLLKKYHLIDKLKAELVYWEKVKKHKKSFEKNRKYLNKILSTEQEISSVNEHINSLNIVYKEHLKIKKIQIYFNDIDKRCKTLNLILGYFKEYRKELFNNSIIPFVLSNINSIVRSVTTDDLSLACTFITQKSKTNSKVKIKDSLIWTIIHDGIELPIEKASGFQRFMFGFSLRIVLNKINQKFQNSQLIIDESFTTFDKTHMSNLESLFNEIRSEYSRLLIISHLSSIRKIVGGLVEINRMEGSSSFNHGEYRYVESAKRGRPRKTY